ncbi:immunoglobulin kappa light chain-like [Alligator sinensis]|uniref:immunoglobulin kappa light chain-like n=1 Tax=Alligator sinensis TaxID=38654 RepID=UPI000D722D60|nr:immunoglobulin kappa light chain-like [Alligator sinensis]
MGGMCRSWVVFAFCRLLGVQLHLHQPQRFLFVEVGGTAEIHCYSSIDVDGAAKLHWYLRRVGEAPILIKKCKEQNESRFACKYQKSNTALEIKSIRRKDSGIYYCAHAATGSLIFGSGTTVIVGDSFTGSSSVLLLGPGAGENGAMDPAHLACVIRGVSNLVQVSWHIPGEQPAQGLPRLLEASDGSLTLIHGISIPWASGAAVTCEVTFNSSGSSVTRHAVYSASPRSWHQQEAVRYMVVGLLVLLMVSLTSLWMCSCSSPAFAASCCPEMFCARPAPQCDCKDELCPCSRDPEQEILTSGTRRWEVSCHERQAVRPE